MDREILNNHLKQVHNQTIFSANLKELVYGGIDGIITTFAVVAGFTGASMTSDESITIPVTVVLVFGLANLFADGFSMGVGDFLSSRAEKKLFEKEWKKEYKEIKETEKFEYDETVLILTENGFTKEDAVALADIYKRNPEFWADFMMRYELNMAHPEDSPVKAASITFISFIMFGAVPLLPYMFDIPSFDGRFATASIFAAIALGVLGIIRARFTKECVIISVLEIVGLGMTAAFIAYFVGTLFT
ncbi:MAG: VIT1/CCC1 transporter family protein [Candidatus Moraniibacteriota bacterium]|jgi:vacuolar iron transporter family protein